MSITRSTSTANLITMSAVRLVIPLCLAIAVTSAYDVKIPSFTNLNPGIRIEYRDDGIVIDLVAFHLSVNKPVPGVRAGDLNVDVYRNADGAFVYENRAVRLKPGDSVNYWVYVVTNGLGYRRLEETWTVAGISTLAVATKATTKATAHRTTQRHPIPKSESNHSVTPGSNSIATAISTNDGPAVTTPQPTSELDNKGLGIPVTAGIAVGAVIIIVIVLVVFFIILRRKLVRSQPIDGGSVVTSRKPIPQRQVPLQDSAAYIHASTGELGLPGSTSDYHRYSYVSIPETTYEHLYDVDRQAPITYPDTQGSYDLYPTENKYPHLPDRENEKSNLNTGNQGYPDLKATGNIYQQLHIASGSHDRSDSNADSQVSSELNGTDRQEIHGDYETLKPESEACSHVVEVGPTYQASTSGQMPQQLTSQGDEKNPHQSTGENVTVVEATSTNSNPGSPGYADLSISWSRYQEVVGGDSDD